MTIVVLTSSGRRRSSRSNPRLKRLEPRTGTRRVNRDPVFDTGSWFLVLGSWSLGRQRVSCIACPRKEDAEQAALVGLALGADLAALTLDQLAGDHQPQAD